MECVLKYPGSKWNIASAIVNLIPEHHSYVEPYFGSGAVFFNKNPSNIETINDLDDDVINLFQCIRENPDELSRLVTTTPYSRKEYDYTYANTDKYFGKCEKARRVLIRCWQGYGYRTNGNKTGWKNDVQGRERAYALKKWYRLPENIEVVAERLRTVFTTQITMQREQMQKHMQRPSMMEILKATPRMYSLMIQKHTRHFRMIVARGM